MADTLLNKNLKNKKYKQLSDYIYNPVPCVHVISYEEYLKLAVTGKLPKNKRFGLIQLPTNNKFKRRKK